MESLAREQTVIGRTIDHMYINYKKDSPSRKTFSYLSARLLRLSKEWDKFEENNIRLLEYKEENKDHAYFSKDFYSSVKAVYEKFNQFLNEAIEQVEYEEETKELDQVNEPSDKKNDKFNILSRAQSSRIEALKQHLKSIETFLSRVNPKSFYEVKLNLIKDYWSSISNNHDRLLNIMTEEDQLEYTDNQYLELESLVQDTLIELSSALEDVTTTSSTTNSQLKLPKITLPIFSGSYLNWNHFRELFVQLVHKQPISDAEKMFYLQSNLTGEAKALIQHLPSTGENYSSAWKTLEGRYDNKRLLVTALLNKLLSQSNIQQESSATIKQLHDITKECILSLQNIGISTASWDPILVHLILKKLDRNTHTLYEQSLESPRDVQSISGLLEFLELRFQALEALGGHKHSTNSTKNQAKSSAFVATASKNCFMCPENHPIFTCKKFLELSPSERLKVIQRNKCCINCLKTGHHVTKCLARRCTKCSKKHNTLLHLQEQNLKTIATTSGKTHQIDSSAPIESTTKTVTLTARLTNPRQGYVLLSTVMLNITNSHNDSIKCRAILDSGSQVNLVSERVIRHLHIKGVPDKMNVHGIGGGRQQAQQRANFVIKSLTSGYSARMEAFVLPRILGLQPSQPIEAAGWSLPHNIKLADPSFYHPDHVDLLIGAEFYYSLLCVGQINLGNGMPTLQNTVFGWVIAGKIDETSQGDAMCAMCSEDDALDTQIQKFWNVEEIDQKEKHLTADEEKCEEHYNRTVSRNSSGRFVVRLPFLQDPELLGESKDVALRRFYSLERRLQKKDDLRKDYIEFMNEYINLGHMQEIDIEDILSPSYFIPHHCVIKPESTTTRLRVVFDASCKTSTNLSLNDILAPGPTIQNDLFTILLRFRMPKFVFSADIQKMYRQILVHEDDKHFQLIFWRSSPQEPLKCYKLNTVTYGTTSAPYLAIKCLKRLAQERMDRYPLGADIVQQNFYVDDVMSGADTISQALELQKQLKDLLSEAGFKLRKWSANHKRLLEGVPIEDVESQVIFDDSSQKTVKILGLTWLPHTDSFCVKTVLNADNKVSKRIAYSDIARLFDPLGIMGPVVVTAKIFLQRLWTLKLDWDSALPMELHTSWIKFREGLKTLNNIKFPRYVFSNEPTKSFQVHVFADASQKAYGAVAYIRSVNKSNQIIVRLLCAKSRVAPIKTVTLPRLELCAAKLAVELGQRIKIDLTIQNEQIFYWSDSEIVLSWINSSSGSYHTFVANRISAIQQTSRPEQWRHISSKQNPADLLSRGVDPDKLEGSTLWFYGPILLHGSKEVWPAPFKSVSECSEEKKRVALPTTREDQLGPFIYHINHHNSFKKLNRITAWVLRFIQRLKGCTKKNQSSELTVQEMDEALITIIKMMQEDEFRMEIKQLKRHGELEKGSSLAGLTPFLDERGLMRVGGRIEASSLSFEAKHPVLLPYTDPLTKLLMTDIHITNHHVGPQTLLSITRQRFWPIKGKTIARSIVQHCVRCVRVKPKLFTQIMGNLPSHRVQPARPFINSGVDFCGPIWIHYKLRGKRPQKAYVAVFCCFSTKATHLELVSDLSTSAFLAALKRFTGRRGHCRNIYCDNATNFVGAKNDLVELKNYICSHESEQKIIQACQENGTDFHFIPPRAPHFGGLWEAAVKSAKHLLTKTIGSASLTYEELETVLIQIEAILNSRPLTPMSSNPNDLTALTPGHFLIGEPLTSIVDPKAETLNVNLLTRWKMVTHIKNEFWRRWSIEYLNELQYRNKWKHECENANPGMMVVLKDDNLSPLKWPLGRIINTIKGNDGKVRVADVKTSSGVLRRPIHKLAPLPVEEVEQTQPQASASNNCIPRRREEEDSNSTKAPDDQGTPVKRKRHSNSALSSLILYCLILPVLGQDKIQVNPFNSNAGIYFEGLGPTHLISNEWNLVIFYDTKIYWRELQLLETGVQQLQTMCDTMIKRNSCKTTVDQFLDLFKAIRINNQLFIHRSHVRNKRAPLDIIGNFASALFGVLDSNYAEKMSKIIEGIDANEHHLLDLIKNQTTIIDSTTNIMKKSQESIENQIDEINRNINKTIFRYNNISQELQEEKIAEQINTLSIQLLIIATNYQRIQASLLDVVMDAHHGKISPLLLSPIQLQQQLNIIKDNLPSNLRLPAKQRDLIELYSLMAVEGRATSNQIIFRIKLPLFSYEEFEMIHIIPVPVPINDTFVIIEPSSEYLIVSLHRDQYYPLSTQEMSMCQLSIDSSFICKQHKPLYRKGSNVSSCELSLLNHDSSPSCKVSETRNIPKWIQLFNSNEWLFVMKSDTAINVVCGSEVNQQILSGSGILKLPNYCTIKNEHMSIQGQGIYPSFLKTSYIPSKNLTDIVPSSKIEEVVYRPKPQQSVLKDIRAIEQKINQLKMNEKLPGSLHVHSTHQTVIGYSGLTIAVIVVIYLLWKCNFFGCKWIKRQKNGQSSETTREPPPQPTPRNTLSDYQLSSTSLHM